MFKLKGKSKTSQIRQLKGRDLILDSIKYTEENRFKSWYHTILTLFLLVFSLAATVYNFHWSLKLFFSVITGLLIVKFFVIYHDYLHEAILKKSKLANIIMTIFGIFVLAPTNIWRRTHNHHHNNNSKLSNHGTGSFPLLSREGYYKLSRKEQLIYLAARHPLTIFFGYITLFILDFNVKSVFISPKKHWDSLISLLVHFAIGLAFYQSGGVSALFLSWIIPFFIANGMGAYLFYAQHNFPGAIFKENKDWDYSDAAIQSTSFLVMNPIMNWFTCDIGYHHVHHVNHNIPFYRLREAMNNMPELQHPKTTTLKIRDVVACLKITVWDSEKEQMTSL